MKRIRLLKQFMNNYVGKGLKLVIKDKDGRFKVHTIEIMQKTDDTCPVKDIKIGDYFLHLLATNPNGQEASIVCNWTENLLKNLMLNYKDAKDANSSEITMFKDPLSTDSNKWLLSWSNDKLEEQEQKNDPIRYIT
jgi:hypothetical protein